MWDRVFHHVTNTKEISKDKGRHLIVNIEKIRQMKMRQLLSPGNMKGCRRK